MGTRLPGKPQAFVLFLHTSPSEQFIRVTKPPLQRRYPLILSGSANSPSSAGQLVLSEPHKKTNKCFTIEENTINSIEMADT